MKGTLVNRNGHYSAILEDKDPVTGKRRQKWISVGDDYKFAQKELTRLVNDKNNGIFVEPIKDNVEQYLKSWLTDSVKPNQSPRTYELYSYMCYKHIIPSIGNISLQNLKPNHLQHLYASKTEKGLSPRTVQLIHVTLHKSLKNALKMGLVVRNVAEAVESPHPERHEMKTLSESDIHIVLEYARDTEYYPIWYTSLFTAMRRSELLALRWLDVDLLGCTVSVSRSMEYDKSAGKDERIRFKDTKTLKSKRSISLTPSNVIVLREHLEARKNFLKSINPKFDPKKDFDKNELVFCHHNGKPYLPESISHAWMKLVRKCGLKGVRLHDTRHTHASLMLKQGVHPKIVQERLGHASITTTLDTYSHVAPGLQKAAAKAFDNFLVSKPKATIRR